MRFIVGLGNPGAEYVGTRHNVGSMVVDEILQRFPGFKVQDSSKFQAMVARNQHVTLIKPRTFMNTSGQAVQAVLNFYHLPAESNGALSALYVIHDDLDLEIGTYKIQFGKGPKIHNGLLSLYDHLHTQQFWHVRIGVDGRQGDRSVPGHTYVLQKFTPTERPIIDQVSNEVIRSLMTV